MNRIIDERSKKCKRIFSSVEFLLSSKNCRQVFRACAATLAQSSGPLPDDDGSGSVGASELRTSDTTRSASEYARRWRSSKAPTSMPNINARVTSTETSSKIFACSLISSPHLQHRARKPLPEPKRQAVRTRPRAAQALSRQPRPRPNFVALDRFALSCKRLSVRMRSRKRIHVSFLIPL